MNLEQWETEVEAGIEGDLPSGLTVRVKKVHILDLVVQGLIPQEIQPMIEQSMNVDGKTPPKTMSMEELKQYHQMVSIVAKACLVGPEGITVERLDLKDRIAIYQWAMEDAKQLQPFRPITPQSMESAQTRQNVFPATKRNRRARVK